MTNKEYAELVKKASPDSRVLHNCLSAFVTGGTICLIGEFITQLYLGFTGDEMQASCLATMTLVFAGALLTALGIYHKLARFGGAGTLVPITGFSNAVAAPAIEFRSEGFITGLGAKIFAIAGPVIVYGTIASTLYGFCYWLWRMSAGL